MHQGSIDGETMEKHKFFVPITFLIIAVLMKSYGSRISSLESEVKLLHETVAQKNKDNPTPKRSSPIPPPPKPKEATTLDPDDPKIKEALNNDLEQDMENNDGN